MKLPVDQNEVIAQVQEYLTANKTTATQLLRSNYKAYKGYRLAREQGVMNDSHIAARKLLGVDIRVVEAK